MEAWVAQVPLSFQGGGRTHLPPLYKLQTADFLPYERSATVPCSATTGRAG